MSEREELAKLLFVTDNHDSSDPEHEWEMTTRHNASYAEYAYELAEAVLDAGYRKPRTILDYEELDTLPIGSVVLDRTGDVARRFSGGWRTTVVEPDGSAWLSGCMEDADLPVTVLHEGVSL